MWSIDKPTKCAGVLVFYLWDKERLSTKHLCTTGYCRDKHGEAPGDNNILLCLCSKISRFYPLIAIRVSC